MIPIITDNGKLLYEQIYEFYRDSILNKLLKKNDKLPSHRSLARELGIGNNTVVRAYEQLIAEGYIRNEKRRGLYVTELHSGEWQLKALSPVTNSEKKTKKKLKPAYNLSDQIVDEKSFPLKQWRKCMNLALDHFKYQYEENDQTDPLKDELIKYLYQYRGVIASPERLIIGSGTNALLFWLAFVLRKTHQNIVFEDPCYPRPRTIFFEYGYNIKSIPLNNNGIDLKKLLATNADLIYLTPSHQFPTGSAIPVGHRLQIIQWARRNKAYIIEDDFDCEFRYKTKLVPSLQGLDKFDRVIYVGSFSNALMPSMRMAYMVMPENFGIDIQAYQYLTNTVSFQNRKTLAYFMEKGYWEQHLKKMRKIYQEKYETCVEALKKISNEKILFNKTPSGLNILLQINTRLSEHSLIKRAMESGVSIKAASQFYYQRKNIPAQPQVLLEFGNIPVKEIDIVIRKLCEAWFTNRKKD